MKRALACCLTLLLLVGCSPTTAPSGSSQPPEATGSSSGPSGTGAERGEALPAISPMPTADGSEGLFLYRQDEVQLDPAAGRVGQMELYTDAEPMEDGTFAMDDRHKWRLLFTFGSDCYELLPTQTLSLGGVEYRAWVDMDTNLLHLLVTVSQSASLTVTEYTFQPDQRQFCPVSLIQADNINLWV